MIKAPRTTTLACICPEKFLSLSHRLESTAL